MNLSVPPRGFNGLFALIALELLGLCTPLPCRSEDVYSVRGSNLLKNDAIWAAGGVNAMDQFGKSTKSGRNIRIVREAIHDFSECPILKEDNSISTPLGYLHPLEEAVQNNRSQGMVTILAIFGWDCQDNRQILGKTPSAEPWYAVYKTRLAALARAFAGQSDVWIEPWNEPYAWNNRDFAESQWLTDMNDLYDTIRVAGRNGNIVVVPTQAMDGEETVLLNQAAAFLRGKSNVAATIHCYNGWNAKPQANSERRIEAIHAKGWALIIGEVGPDKYEKDCTRLLNAAIHEHVSTLAWSWSARDGSALVEHDLPSNWGTAFFPYLNRYEKTDVAKAQPSPDPGKVTDQAR